MPHSENEPQVRPFREKLLPAPVSGGFRMKEMWVWGASVIRGEDGRYHMFASMWTKAVPFQPNWLTNSRIVRAVADTPEGPYAYAGEVLEPRGEPYWDARMLHNPTIHRHDDTYLLFYTGSTYAGPTPHRGAATQEQRLESRQNQRIGLAYAKQPEGPWMRLQRPIVDVRLDSWDALITVNPAPLIEGDGSVVLMYKSTAEHRAPLQYGVARARHWLGPYRREAEEPITFRGDSSVSYEDVCMWKQEGHYHMIFKDMKGDLCGEHHAGVHAISRDAKDWQLAPEPLAYSKHVLWDDGETRDQGSLERPQLLIQDGVPTHLFAATSDGTEGFTDADNTWNMCVPLEH